MRAGNRSLLASFTALAGLIACGTRDPAGQMTSYSGEATKEKTAELFSVTPEQMAHL